jgi:DNA-binding response OmpR family regulator
VNTERTLTPELGPLPTLVVCEDDAPTLELLCDHLEADRYRALPAPSASDALRLCHYKQPDLLLLDLRLPDAFGLEVLREVRASEGATGRYDPELPVIILSGRGSEADRMRGFSEGADDYVVKPFHYPEVAARVRAVLWRRAGRRQGPLRVGEIVVDTARREVRVAGRPVKLANKEFAKGVPTGSDDGRENRSRWRFPPAPALSHSAGFRSRLFALCLHPKRARPLGQEPPRPRPARC